MFHLRRPSAAALRALLAEQSEAPLSYAEVGRSLAALPSGYQHLTVRRRAGAGPDAMERARSALRSWAGHRALGMRLHPERPELDVDATVAFALRPAPLAPWVTGACRIVAVVDEPRRFGFAYGTLPHHPEIGEEAFLAHRRDDGAVEFEITAFSRPSTRLLALAGPLGRRIQRRSAETYLTGLVEPPPA